jgi:negative regulator of replication initiation
MKQSANDSITMVGISNLRRTLNFSVENKPTLKNEAGTKKAQSAKSENERTETDIFI